MKRRLRWRPALLAAMLCQAPVMGLADTPPDTPSTQSEVPMAPQPGPQLDADERSGREIFQQFRSGLADPNCDDASGGRWRKQFGHAPRQLADAGVDALPMFGYVVDALRDADLPTEFALIPFVESGYRPGARSGSGPAGLWQFIGLTARNHGVAVAKGYDGRLSPVDSTRAAVRYLKTLYGMFGGDWRLAVMAYNAGEYRVLKSMQRAGMSAANAQPTKLPGLSGITYAYVEKLHALACVFQQAGSQDQWLQALDRPVPRLAPQALPVGSNLSRWADQQDHDPNLLKRLNPALADAPSTRATRMVLAPTSADGLQPITASSLVQAEEANAVAAAGKGLATLAVPAAAEPTAAATRSHTVQRGESIWSIARHYGLRTQDLQAANQLGGKSVLRPGTVLKLDGETGHIGQLGSPAE